MSAGSLKNRRATKALKPYIDNIAKHGTEFERSVNAYHKLAISTHGFDAPSREEISRRLKVRESAQKLFQSHDAFLRNTHHK